MSRSVVTNISRSKTACRREEASRLVIIPRASVKRCGWIRYPTGLSRELSIGAALCGGGMWALDIQIRLSLHGSGLVAASLIFEPVAE